MTRNAPALTAYRRRHRPIVASLRTLRLAGDFERDRGVGAFFLTVVGGARPDPDMALATAAAELSFRNGWSAKATFQGQFSDATRSYAGKGSIRYNW